MLLLLSLQLLVLLLLLLFFVVVAAVVPISLDPHCCGQSFYSSCFCFCLFDLILTLQKQDCALYWEILFASGSGCVAERPKVHKLISENCFVAVRA